MLCGVIDIDDKMYTAQDIKDFKIFLELELKREEEENGRTQSRRSST